MTNGGLTVNMFNHRKVLVTGGTGMIGRYLVELLLERGAKVRIASLDDPSRAHPDAEFMRLDLTDMDACVEACAGMDDVFHLAGIKGSPKMTREKPASFFVPTILFNTHMMDAARRAGVENYLYTSSVGVYAPSSRFFEEDVWKTFPSPNDRFAGWAKRMGELQKEAYEIEYGWKNICVVRPANVYGPYDNFDPENAMVIPSLIHRVSQGENPLVVWGDGSQIRDFIHAKDVARGMLHMMDNRVYEPVNLGSGTGVSIRQIVEIITENWPNKIQVIWDTSKPAGDAVRILDTQRAESHGFKPSINIAEGIREVLGWYQSHGAASQMRYNVFR